ncbi:MAG TPA: RdgB/HAM1 family non-canonical purine NTP pyrophosphatase [Acidimicrobiia bacterium]|nr:RdgB/HAM1 family non-canonical purine NTP pyrophosphatase [Acidimicrobiia bacterium]
MKFDRLVVASKNPDKIKEIAEVLAGSGLGLELVDGLSWPNIEETGETLEENALKKAREVFDATGIPSVADDTGLFVNALGGLPGVNTARFAGPHATYADNVARLLEELKGIEDRTASFRSVVALVAENDELIAEGVLDGFIALAPRGSGGFGYDPVFEVSNGRTLAELDANTKNMLSHRATALRNLFGALASPGLNQT